ncbi:MAG: ABC transporter ATP-binding protein [Acidobacteria bacterium]|nr:ABC transporter ATP-binding protein [Acidobacteriota bacterium]
MSALLEVEDITKTFSGITALDNVSLNVDSGERVGLIGPNGAGKTTLFNCVLGQLNPDEGAVRLGGEELVQKSVSRRVKAGIGRTFQRIELFSDTSVREHLLIAERVRNGTGSFLKDLTGRGRPRKEEIERCDYVLELLGLRDLATEPIEKLSLGKGRLVEVGRALMTEPSLLLLDEPSSGLDRDETSALAETLRSVQAEAGFAILLVEHDVELVVSFTERCYVLDFGTVISKGSTAEVMADPVVRKAYLGTAPVEESQP